MSRYELPKSLMKGTKAAKKNYQFSYIWAILPVEGHHWTESALESLQTYGKRLILSFMTIVGIFLDIFELVSFAVLNQIVLVSFVIEVDSEGSSSLSKTVIFKYFWLFEFARSGLGLY